MALSTETVAELTSEQVSSILTRPLEARSVFLAAGPRIFDTSGPLRIPSLPTSNADELEFVGENEQIPETDSDWGEVSLLPSTMKSVKTITRYSNELARQAVVSLDTALRDRLVADVAAKLDEQFLSDAGDGITTPLGLFAYEGVQEVSLSGPLTLDGILDAQGLILAANANPDALTLFVRPADYMAARKVKDSDGRYLLQADARAGGVVVPLLGAKVAISPRVPAGHAALADMSQVGVGRDLAPSVKVLTERYADYDQQAIRVVARYDAKPLNPEAIVTFSGIAGEAGSESGYGDDGGTGYGG